MFAMVEIKGCILNFAVKNPEMVVKNVHSSTHTNNEYTFNRRAFFLQNGLYIAIILIFIMLCIITPIVTLSSSAVFLRYFSFAAVFSRSQLFFTCS